MNQQVITLLYPNLIYILSFRKELFTSDQCLRFKHIKGSSNVVTDLLTFIYQQRDEYTNLLAYNIRPDNILTQRSHSFLPQFIPQSFNILPSDIKISSFSLQAL